MKPFVASVLTLIIIASVAEAQRPRGQGQRQGPGGFGITPLMLLTQKSVQEDLKLSEEQTTKVSQIEKNRREALQGLRNLSREDRQAKITDQNKADDKAIAEALKPEQLKRLKQITLQQRGTRAFGDAEVAAALKLTKEQQDQIKTIQDDVRKEMSSLRGVRGDDRRKKMEEIRKSADEKLMNVLTPDQKAAWKDLQGEPFKGEIKRPEGGGRRRRDGK